MSCTTSDERREVAERLREQLRYMREDNCYEEDLNVVDCGNSAYRNIAGSVEPYGNFKKGNYVHIVERLVDLIDPTCHLVGTTLQTWTDGTHAFYHELSCGHTCETVWAKPPAFCNECGARVVERGEADGD